MIWWSLRFGVLVAALCLGAVYALGPTGAVLSDRGGRTVKAAPPPRAAAIADFGSELKVRAAPDGHYYVEADVNNTTVRFVVDTGASAIALSPEDAARIGLRPQPHEYTMRANTANGVVKLAPVSLREVRLGNFTAYEVEAAVNRAPMQISLLGMSFLKRLQSYEVRGGELHLRW